MKLDTSILTSFKKIDEASVDALLSKEISANTKKIVVLDDDPTGVQTVHDISVYAGLMRAFSQGSERQITFSTY